MKVIIFSLFFVSLFPLAFAQEYPELGVKVETVADNLTIPWSIDWTPNGDAFFTERNGNVRLIQDGILLDEPILSLGVGRVEGGMLGIAVDPNYNQNNYIYVYYTYNDFISTINKVVRYQWTDDGLVENKVLIDGIPGGPFHDGGRIQFGPDGKLYITTGDAGDPNLSQNIDSVAGKILRINSDGTIPEDNPWAGSPVYSIGHRNPQGIDWDSKGNLVSTEHGPSGWRGSAHDEINVITPGGNYGWPDVIGDEVLDGAINPILHTGEDTWAPSGAEFYDGEKISQWTGKYFVAALRGSHLHMVDFDLENNKVNSHEKLFQDDFGRLRDVQTGPDGYLYLLTSNQDGRGFPNPNDDKILRIVPLNNINYLCNYVSEENPIDVKVTTEKVGEITNIKVTGCVDEIAHFKGINLQILGPEGDFVIGGAVVPNEDGTFERIFEKEILINGTYSVIADANGEFSATNTFVIPEFGSIVIMVMIVSIGVIIALSRMYPRIQV